MENQHRHIKGYRELTANEVALMNEIKGHGERLAMLIEEMERNVNLDERWIAIAKTDLQKGLMSLTRAVAQPTTF